MDTLGGVLLTAVVLMFWFFAPILWFGIQYIGMRIADWWDYMLREWRGYGCGYREKH